MRATEFFQGPTDCSQEECDALLNQLDQQVQREEWLLADASFDRFRHASREHFGVEERQLFPAFERTDLFNIGSANLMRAEHQQMLFLMECMGGALAARGVPAYLDLSLQLRGLLLQHARKEEFLLEVLRGDDGAAKFSAA
jgi:hypothetical protein